MTCDAEVEFSTFLHFYLVIGESNIRNVNKLPLFHIGTYIHLFSTLFYFMSPIVIKSKIVT